MNNQTNDKSSDHRLQLLRTWLDSLNELSPYQVTPLAGDASFRRYFRIHFEKCSWIAMDAPPDRENCRQFIDIAKRIKQTHLNVPDFFAINIEQGFLLLSDFGDRLLLDELSKSTANHYYEIALRDLIMMQTANTANIPDFDQAFMLQEIERFETWYLKQYRDIELTSQERQCLQNTYQQLILSANEQPHVFIHRDYHSRNLMILDEKKLGIIDFQDAMRGPITYDVVSLLHDCYITWPREEVLRWLQTYLQTAQHANLISRVDQTQFVRWFDWMGLQRHLKVLGIFARLYLRDSKPNYLQDIPRVLQYIIDVSNRYPELTAFNELMRKL